MQFDPRDPGFRASPYATYHRLRREDPVHYRAARGDWLLTRYDDIFAVLGDRRFGHSEKFASGSFMMSDTAGKDPVTRYRKQSEALLRLWILLSNPPEHARRRQAAQPHFTPSSIATLRPQVQELVDEIIEQVQPLGAMDIIHDLAYPLPVTIICELLGIPAEARAPAMKQWTDELSAALDYDVTPLAHTRGMLAFARFAEYFEGLIEGWKVSSRGHPALLDSFKQAEASGALTREEIISNCIILFFAGHSTIQHLIGNGMLALLQHTEQFRLLRDDPMLIQSAVHECLRYDGPLQMTWRTAMATVEINGSLIEEGQHIILLLGSANRDPEQFPEPDLFDIRRPPGRILSFGRGIHNCIGVHLAQMVAQIAIGALVSRLPNLELGPGPLEWEDTFLVRGLRRLPVRFSTGSAP
jgi:pimeloyl-[acyl-carrier protein] synthase